jgi:hypothetical protein
MISDLEKKRRREAVIDTLASLAGSAQWLAVGSRGHNLSTVLHCIAEGLVSQRSPTGAKGVRPYPVRMGARQAPIG